MSQPRSALTPQQTALQQLALKHQPHKVRFFDRQFVERLQHVVRTLREWIGFCDVGPISDRLSQCHNAASSHRFRRRVRAHGRPSPKAIRPADKDHSGGILTGWAKVALKAHQALRSLLLGTVSVSAIPRYG